jgi:hypothetical protein
VESGVPDGNYEAAVSEAWSCRAWGVTLFNTAGAVELRAAADSSGRPEKSELVLAYPQPEIGSRKRRIHVLCISHRADRSADFH